MLSEDTIQVWADGSDFIIKKVEATYYFRPANESGAWQPGLPSGLVFADAHLLFNDAIN